MTESVVLVPVPAADVALGKPLPWSVYDWHGKLLYASGIVLDNQQNLDEMLNNGYVNDTSWDAELSQPAAPVDIPKPQEAGGIAEVSKKKEETIDMDDVRWFVGEMLYLQQRENSAIRYTVRLIGFVKNKTLLVSAPVSDGKMEFIREGQVYVVRAFSGKKAYAFTTSAVKSVHIPHPYLHLSYPKQVRCTQVRQAARAQVKIIAAVGLGNPERPGVATLNDLSMGGTSGIIKQPLGKKGEIGKIKFKVNAAEHDEYLNLKIVLRSVTPSDQGDGFKHGFEFVDISIHDRLILSAFVHQTLVETE